MSEQLSWSDFILNGKSIFPILRRLLNFVMVLSVTYYFYEKHYGEVDCNLYFDRVKMLEFLLKGAYIIPLSISVVVYVITEYSAQIIFFLINYFLSLRYERKILQSSISPREINEMLRKVENVSEVVTPIKLTPDLLKKAYLEIRKTMGPEILKMEAELKNEKKNSESNFIFWFRILLTCIFYLSAAIPNYGWRLFTITVISMVVLMISSIFYYQTLNIIPTALRKFHFEAEKYLIDQHRITKKPTSNENIK